MKKFYTGGKALIAYVSVFAVLAVSILSIFTGISFVASAEDGEAEQETTVTYPLNGTYDADVVFKDGGITYTDASSMNKTVVSDFTAFDTTFWLTAKGNGTAANPFIIETANQFAAVAINNLVYDSNIATSLDISRFTIDANGYLDTAGVAFKVADNIKAFNMNNTESTVDFSGDMTAEQVENALADAPVKSGLRWEHSLGDAKAPVFKGTFNGNGVTVYGLKGYTGINSGLFPKVGGADIRNLTVKNCYFNGDRVGVLIGNNSTAAGLVVRNCAIYNNVAVCTRKNDCDVYGGVIVGFVYSGVDTNWQNGTINLYDSLIYGNDVKHSKTVAAHNNEYNFKYGLFGNSSNKQGAVVTNCIVLDSAPYSLWHGYNAFYNSTYATVYTNTLDMTITNTGYKSDGAVKVENVTETVVNSDGSVTQKFNVFENGTDKNINYERKHDAGTLIKVEASDVQGSAAKSKLSALDWDKWTVSVNGYATPKIYNIREYSAGSAWTGDVALTYSGGDGSSSSPYMINTAEELALMMTSAKAGECFALGADIVINDTSKSDWTNSARQWFTSNDMPAFEGTLDGKGHSVSGIYYTGKQAGEYGGLIPVLGANAAVKNITIKDSEFNGGSKYTFGAVSGRVDDNSPKIIKLSAVTVKNSVEFKGGANVGGIIGKIGYSGVNINDCISETSGLFVSVEGQANVKRCVSVGAYPFGDTNYIKAENVYTDTNGASLEGVTVLANDEMKGDAASTNMAGLNFPTSWAVVADAYPAPTGNEASSEGVKGEVWSGAIATSYASGRGTASDPYIIETAEQLALCVYNPQSGMQYKLGADIYLNDVNGNLWSSKVGCNEWFTQYNVRSTNTGNGFVFDGDGYVIYGLYLNHTANDQYWRAGLFPYLQEKGTIRNVGLSEAYLAGSFEFTNETIGGIVGIIPDWDNAIEMPTHSRIETIAVTTDPAYAARIPVIENCFVDHTCYIKGRTAGGILGATGGTFTMDNCSFTGTVEGSDRDSTSSFVGNDWGFGSRIYHSVSLPLSCNRPAGGASNSDWRDSLDYWCTLAYKVYYFSLYRMSNTYFEKLSNPEMFLGQNAVTNMPGLDWEETKGDGGLWRAVDGGTPVLTIFGKHRTDEELEKFSLKGFPAPSTRLSFSTGTSEVSVDDIVASMYSKITLPTPKREGYTFKGWHTFSDLSYLYPYDYQPPRDLVLYAEWEPLGIIQGFENYTNTQWDYDGTRWELNRPGAKHGYQNAYVRKGGKSMRLLDTSTESSDVLLNYEDMLTEGKSYTMTFWVNTDKANNPDTLLSLVHNSKPEYLDSEVSSEPMAVITGLKVGEWVQYSYSFTAKTKWVSLRATGSPSLYFDDVMIIPISGSVSSNSSFINNGGNNNGLSPNTGDNTVTVAALVSAIMVCAIFAVISRKNLIEVIDN